MDTSTYKQIKNKEITINRTAHSSLMDCPCLWTSFVAELTKLKQIIYYRLIIIKNKSPYAL